ncbi:ATP-dependent DNA helicase [Rhynchospora pubera]|uniref:ATP-dependent DNA helicase n=1 Tax=Rhynchospora pubera TaxID=906938 RepID=A0AAV8FGI9_9POAL|nr:ATP-dependent DNA helicase [Rhynchospora pubera]
MVIMPNQSKIRPDPIGTPRATVKLEIEDSLEDEHGPFNKRSKLGISSNQPQQQDMYNNVLDEPSPLGLRLRKSPSLLDLIQMKLAHSKMVNSDSSKKKEDKSSVVASSNERLKASNFPANVLRIGKWECVSRYEGDLVAKCYYAKHKLVWEVLDGGLKSKIEIQWSDITSIKAICPEDGPGTLDVVLARPPLFFKETDPQPRKHTLWQATSDFTGGQASINRRHFLQCPSGLLSKNFEKLVQCDPRLHLLSQQPEIVLESPFFEPRCAMFEDMEQKKPHCFSQLQDEMEPSFSGFIDPGSPSLSISTKSEGRDSIGMLPDFNPQASNGAQVSTSSSQKMLRNPSLWEQLNAQGLLKASMSVDDLVNHLGNCISEQMTSGNSDLPGNAMPPKEMLEDLAQYLLSDTQAASSSDEKSLMARVNSLCCLIQKDTNNAGGQNNMQSMNGSISDEDADSDGVGEDVNSKLTIQLNDNNNNSDDVKEEKPAGMSRKDSFGDLLLHLPRIASMPQFLFNISEDSENER